MIVNVGLAIFNLLPIPPLDGSHVAESLMPYRWRGAWEQFARFSPFLLLAVIVFGGSFIAGPVASCSASSGASPAASPR